MDLGSNSRVIQKPETRHNHLTPNPTSARIIDKHGKLPPRASAFLPVEIDTFPHGKAQLKWNFQLLLEKEVGVARGLLRLRNRRARILVMNFRNEPEDLTEGTAVAHVEGIAEFLEV